MTEQEPIQLTIRLLTLPEIRTLYKERMVHDFPADELKPLTMIERAVKRGEYRCYGGLEGGAIAAYAFFVTNREEGQTIWLFDYLAVDEARRDRGIGSAFLQGLGRDVLPEAEMVLLEIDDPAFAEGAEREHRLRREAFYLRNGLIPTGVTANVFHVDFSILEVPVHGTHAQEACRAGYEAIYRRLLPPFLFRQNIRINGHHA